MPDISCSVLVKTLPFPASFLPSFFLNLYVQSYIPGVLKLFSSVTFLSFLPASKRSIL